MLYGRETTKTGGCTRLTKPLLFSDVFDEADRCGDHPLYADSGAIRNAMTILAAGGCDCFSWDSYYPSCNSYCNSGSFAIGELGGQIVIVEECSDTSGHGCRCDGSLHVVDGDMNTAIRYLNAQNRKIAEPVLRAAGKLR